MVTPREYAEFAEKEYRNLYHDNKWSAVKTDPDSSFYSGDGDRGGSRGDGGRGRGRGHGGRGCGKNRWEKYECHNCGKLGHIERFCWLPGGGAYKSRTEDADEGGGNGDGDSFPGTNSDAISRPPRGNAHRHTKLANGDEVVWYGKCSKWKNHFKSGHMTGSNSGNDGDGARFGNGAGVGVNNAGNSAETKEEELNEDDVKDGGAFARLRLAGLI